MKDSKTLERVIAWLPCITSIEIFADKLPMIVHFVNGECLELQNDDLTRELGTCTWGSMWML